VVEGLFSNDATFVRTPKQGNAPAASTVPPTEPLRLLMTGGMALYYAAAVAWVVSEQYWLSLPFMLLFGTGFALSFLALMLEGFRTVECSETALKRTTSQPVGD